MTREPSAAERARFGDAVEVAAPRDAAEAGALVRAAEAAGGIVHAAGLGAHAEAPDAGPRPPALLLSAAAFAGVATYEPDDFTIGVGAGMPLAEFRDLLARHGQEIPHDLPPSAAGTVGGLVARAPWTPREGGTAPLHALVLGVEGVRGEGKPFRAGGMVVKNVAGYQVHKLCVGALGRLGLLTRVNFRLRPRPEHRVARTAPLAAAADAARLLGALRARGVEPACFVVVSGTWRGTAGGPRAVWVLEGSGPRVAWLEKEADAAARDAGVPAVADDAAAWLPALAGAEEPAADRGGGIARLTVAAADAPAAGDAIPRGADIAADALTGRVIVRWSDAAGTAPRLDALASLAGRLGGLVRLVHLDAARRDAWPRDVTPDPNAALAARVATAFDPHGVFGGAHAAAAAADAGARG